MAGGPEDRTGDHVLGGVYYALVTQNDDKDGPGGRVRVRYPWLPEGDRDQSFWAPVAVPMVGASFGTYHLPEVDDTVLVMFQAGDMRHPIVVGGTWSQTDPPPETNEDGKNNFRLIKSRSGHRAIFDDTGKTKVVVSDKSNAHLVSVGEFGREGSSPNAVEVPAQGSQKGVAASATTGAIKIWCQSGTLTIKGKSVEVTAGGSADIKGTQMELKGGQEATLSATGSGKYQGTTIKLGGG